MSAVLRASGPAGAWTGDGSRDRAGLDRVSCSWSGWPLRGMELGNSRSDGA